MSITRSTGILMPISSLPTKYGIGTLGKEAYNFVDFLVKAKQSYWQILPIGPTSYGDSPYSSFSSFAGNPYFIDLDTLVEEGLLKKEEIESLKNDKYIDYGYIYETRFEVLKKAYNRGVLKDKKEFEQFINDNNSWLDDYSFYMACKKNFKMVAWTEWPQDIRLRKADAVKKYRELLKDDMKFWQYLQFLFFKQYNKLKKYTNSKGIKIIGDLPIYVAMDSADVWAHTDCFQLDESTYVPKEVSGVPPDYFSEDGQLWGNPLYHWENLKKNGYKFWIDRVGGSTNLYDVIRIDHFRAFASYWAVPFGEKTAKKGRWLKGPGMDLIGALTGWFRDTTFIAEDLGVFGQDVVDLLRDSKLPGMKILQFGFNASEPSEHTPFMYPNPNYIVYTGTHDNSTLMGWKATASKKDVKYAYDYMNVDQSADFCWSVIREGMKSISNLFIVQMQDYLGLDDSARINLPSTVGNNWKWRIDKEEITDELAEKIAEMTTLYARAPKK